MRKGVFRRRQGEVSPRSSSRCGTTGAGGNGSVQLRGQAAAKMNSCSQDGYPSQSRKSMSAHEKAPRKMSNSSASGSPAKGEIPKKVFPRRRSSNLIAKLMGLDPLPGSERSDARQKDSSSENSREFKDVFVVQEMKNAENRSRAVARGTEDQSIMQRHAMDADRFSMNEELKKSQKFGETLDLLDSRKDLLLKFLEEPKTHVKTLLKNCKPPQPAGEARITILKSSNVFLSDMANTIEPCFDLEAVPSRIVVLKPSIHKFSEAPDDHQFVSGRGSREMRRSGRREVLYELRDGEMTHKAKRSGEIAKQVTRHMRRTISNRDAKRHLSERWTTAHKEPDSLSSAGCSTLGEMLAFSDLDGQDMPLPGVTPISPSSLPERIAENNNAIPSLSTSSGHTKSISDCNDFATVKTCSSRSFSSSSVVEKYCAVDPDLQAEEKEAMVMAEEVDQPSPISVLQPESFERLSADLRELRLKLQLLKLESGSTDAGRVMFSDEDDDRVTEQESDTETELAYLMEVLAEAGFCRNDWEELFFRFFSPELPICPDIFHRLEKSRSDNVSSQGKSERKLLFDMFNAVLADLLSTNIELRPWVKKIRLSGDRRNLIEEVRELLCRRHREAISSNPFAFLEDSRWSDSVDDVDSVGRDVERVMMDDLLLDLVSDCIHF